jgi:hypothetical protein
MPKIKLKKACPITLKKGWRNYPELKIGIKLGTCNSSLKKSPFKKKLFKTPFKIQNKNPKKKA